MGQASFTSEFTFSLNKKRTANFTCQFTLRKAYEPDLNYNPGLGYAVRSRGAFADKTKGTGR